MTSGVTRDGSTAAAPIEVPVLGVPTRVWTYGAKDGEPVILVHGFRGDHHGLERIAQGLADELPECTFYVPDLPGFGQSEAVPAREHTIDLYSEWLRVFTDAVAPGGFAVFGHSFGSIVVAAAVADGLDPTAVILGNPISAPALEGPQRAMSQVARGYYAAANALPERAARALLGNRLIVRAMSEVMVRTPERPLREWIHDQHHQFFSVFSDPETLLQAFDASITHTVTEYAASFTAPVLIIAGEKDDIAPLAGQVALQRRIRGAQLSIMPGSGHLIHYECVDAVVDDSARFLRAVADKKCRGESA